MERGDGGFSLVELMTVVMIIAILVAIAIPTFLGARESAADRAVQANIRTAFAAAKAFYVENNAYVEDAALMESEETSLNWAVGDTPLAANTVYIHVHAAPHELFLSAMSTTGVCFYLRDVPASNATQFAEDGSCGVADTQVYAGSW